MLDFGKAFDLIIANSCFHKREEHLFTFQSTVAKIQIDYLIFKRCDRGLCSNCNVITSENIATQHRLLVIHFEIKRRTTRAAYGQPKIKRGALTKDVA